MKLPKVPIIVGPTAVGKTEISLALAERFDSGIVSADSRQVYQKMNIGTAKPELDAFQKVPHFLIDFLDPTQSYSAGLWGRDALSIITDLLADQKQPIVVGGSGFYIRALIQGFFEEPAYNREDLESLRTEYKAMRTGTLRRLLKKVDPISAKRIMPNDRQRAIRALEIYEITGRPLSELQALQKSEHTLPFEPIFIGLEMPREELYARINRRTDQMILAGLVEEVETLVSEDYDPELNSLQTVGYREIFPYLQGRTGLYEAVRLIKRNTRRYAKRQTTWFRHNEKVHWLDAEARIEKIVSEILSLL